MRKFLLINLATLSASLIITSTALYSMHASNINTSFIKNSLAEHNTYNKLAVFLNKSAASNNPLTEKSPYQVTEDILQTTSEQLIDDIESWIKGEIDEPPQISFASYQSKVVEEQRAKILERDSSLGSFTPPPGFTQGFSDPFTLAMQVTEGEEALFPIGARMQFAKDMYQLGQTLRYIVPITLIITLALLLLLAKKKLQMIKWLAIVCALTALYSLLVLATSSILPAFFSTQFNDLATSPSIAIISPVLSDITNTYQTELQKNLLILASATLVTSISLLTFYVKTKRTQAKQKTLLAETRLAHAQENLKKLTDSSQNNQTPSPVKILKIMKNTDEEHTKQTSSEETSLPPHHSPSSQNTHTPIETSQQSAQPQPPEKKFP